ncbi:phosphatase PAP2 family protein [Zavarzinella formosa]|uniref:phosphatase PAP2 family protein n=1 Tax=Zavarzinella formosa TaxID=360055 RepID=UPI00031699E9|nr:phosphatase PAP2 family protein [Zavarzinella formosa]
MIRRLFTIPWLIPAVIGGLLFLLIGWDISANGLLAQFDHAKAEPLYQFGLSSVELHRVIVFVTNLGVGDFIITIGCLNLLILILHREWRLTAAFAAGQWSVYRIISLLKNQYARPRPPFLDLGEFSFPSGHAFGSAVIYGLSIFVVWRLFPSKRYRWPLMAVLALMILGISASRPLYGAHYVSDVVAGTTLGLSYVCLLISLGSPRGLKQGR